MEKAKTNSTTTLPQMPKLDVEAIIDANQRSLLAAAEAQNHMLRRMSRFNEEMMRFVNQRLEQDREAAKTLTACKTPMDAMAAYGRFLELAVKDYSEEMGLMAGIYADMARETVEDAQHQVEETINPDSAHGKPLPE